MLYEDKLLQYELLTRRGFPAIPTFASNSEQEAIEYVRACSYPAVWKVAAGVRLARRRAAAQRRRRRALGPAGVLVERAADLLADVGQKDYVYLQRLEPNRGWDLRVLVIGDAFFGYYRDVPEGEFRASGMGRVRRAAPPDAALRLAGDVARALDLSMLAVDMLATPGEDRFLIIELSPLIQVNTPMQLRVDDVPGTLWRTADGGFDFVPGMVWPQELALQRLLRRRWIAPRQTESGAGA